VPRRMPIQTRIEVRSKSNPLSSVQTRASDAV
jgi:hypothetical protein